MLADHKTKDLIEMLYNRMSADELIEMADERDAEKCVECGEVVGDEEGWRDSKLKLFCDDCKEGADNYDPLEGVVEDEVETDGWEEVYNGGQPRENPRIPGQEGIFYQTYGNGGGAGGWGGYWAMRLSNGQHMPGVYEVAGNQFKMLEGVLLEFRPEEEMRGVVAAVRIVPM